MREINEYIHPLSRMHFPAIVDQFERGDRQCHDKWGHNISIDYHCSSGSPITATVYVYPSEPGTLELEFALVEAQIAACNQNVEIIGHDKFRIGEIKGLYGNYAMNSDLGTLRSTLHLFECQGWFVKYRVTGSQAAFVAAGIDQYHEFIGAFGRPAASEQAADLRMKSLSRAAASRQILEQWEPSTWELDKTSGAILIEVSALREAGRLGDAIKILTEAVKRIPGQASLYAELGRLQFLTGEITAAAETYLTLEGLDTKQAEPLGSALRNFESPEVTYAGGLGAEPNAAVRIEGATTKAVGINAVYRYLEHILGLRGSAWNFQKASVICGNKRCLDAMEVILQSGDIITVFFDVTDVETELSAYHTDDYTTLGHITEIGDVRDGISASNITLATVEPEWIQSVLIHLVGHQAQNMLLLF